MLIGSMVPWKFVHSVTSLTLLWGMLGSTILHIRDGLVGRRTGDSDRRLSAASIRYEHLVDSAFALFRECHPRLPSATEDHQRWLGRLSAVRAEGHLGTACIDDRERLDS